MKILVTGSKGFIGKNLIAELRNRKYTEILSMIGIQILLYLMSIAEADFVFHLAGVNRPKDSI